MDGQARLRRTDDPKGIYSLQTEQERIERKNIEICNSQILDECPAYNTKTAHESNPTNTQLYGSP